jgi:integration host factor subunit beta
MAEKLTKAELIDALYENSPLRARPPGKKFTSYRRAFFRNQDRDFNGKTVELRGFGTFEVKLRKGRTRARNPKTGRLSPSRSRRRRIPPGRELKKSAWDMDPRL